jgi:hypothetical protein
MVAAWSGLIQKLLDLAGYERTLVWCGTVQGAWMTVRSSYGVKALSCHSRFDDTGR